MGAMRALVLACVVASSGCALLANANAHHNSGGTACLDMPIFGAIDLLIAAGSAAIIANTETSNGWYAVPGVFGASGLLGTVSAIRCREAGASDPYESNAPPASNSAPDFGEAPVDPEAREATREEMLGPASVEPRILDRNGLPTVLPPVTEPPPTPPNPTAQVCRLDPRVDCPDGYYCRLVSESAGECVEIR